MPAVPAEMDQVLPILLLAFANESKVSTRYLRSLDAEREQIIAGLEAVNQQLTQAGKRPVFELKVLSQANIHQIFDAFSEHGSRIAAFHFSGHADGYQLLLESTDGGPPHIAHAGGLVSFFRQQPHLKLVFLNGCSTFQQTKELADEGIPSVIGTDREIQDEVAAQFATRLYRSLALGAPIGQAFHAAATLVESLEGRGLMRSLELEETEDALAPSRGIPWELFSNEPDWNLGSEANNPLLGLPEPILARKPKAERPDPPANPFRYLDRYQAEHSEVFFGRGQEIRQFFSLLSTQLRSSLLLLHGQSGVGKSSFLEAGIFPRLSGYTQVVYVRRDVTLQLRDSLLAALPENAEGDTLTERVGCMLAHHAWNDAGENPFFPLPKVVLLVDQAEESFTRQQPNARPEVEWREFLKAIAPLVLHPELRQEVRVVLSFRKGYLAEIKGFCLASGLPWEDVFMRPLNQRGIEEIITGGTSSQRLRDAYQLEMELGSRAEDKHLPNLIAGDLLENKETAIAPILQILLSRMWEGTETQFQQSGKRFWSIADYQRNKRAGMLMKDFLDQQLSLLAQHPDFHHAASNGLALDVLTFHTTSLGTADQRSWAEIEEHYGTDRSDLRALIDQLIELRLLNLRSKGVFGLAHDTLSPPIRDRFAKSDLPGQRAHRLLENKTQVLRMTAVSGFEPEKDQSVSTFIGFQRWLRRSLDASESPEGPEGPLLDPADLRTVEQGRAGMRKWDEFDRAVLNPSFETRDRAIRQQKRNQVYLTVGIVVLGGLIFWGLWNLRELGRLAELEEASRMVYASERSLSEQNYPAAMFWASQSYIQSYPILSDLVVNQLYQINVQMPDSLDSLRAVIHLSGMKTPEERACLAPNGTWVARWGGNRAPTVINWRTNSGWQLEATGTEVQELRFDDQSQRLLTLWENGDLILYDTLGQQQAEFALTSQLGLTPLTAAFVPQTTWILIGTNEGQLLAWDWEQQAIAHQMQDQGPVVQIEVRQDGRYLLTQTLEGEGNGEQENFQTRLWERTEQTGWKPAQSGYSEQEMLLDDAIDMAFGSKAGEIVLLLETDDAVKVKDIETDKTTLLNRFPGMKIRSISALSGQRYLAVGSERTARIFGAQGELIDEFTGLDSIVEAQYLDDGGLILLQQDGIALFFLHGISVPAWTSDQLSLPKSKNHTAVRASGEGFLRQSFEARLQTYDQAVREISRFFNWLVFLAFVNFAAHLFLQYYHESRHRTSARGAGYWLLRAFLLAFTIFAGYILGLQTNDGEVSLTFLGWFGGMAFFLNAFQALRNFQNARYELLYAWVLLDIVWLVMTALLLNGLDRYEILGKLEGNLYFGPLIFAILTLGAFSLPPLKYVMNFWKHPLRKEKKDWLR